MKINSGKLGFAGGITISIFYSLYTLAMMAWGDQFLKIISDLHHFENVGLVYPHVQVTAYNFGIGLLSHFIIAYLILYTLGSIYNGLSNN